MIGSGNRVLDVGAAPGSWSQLAVKLVGPRGLVIAVDLSELSGLEGLGGVVPVVGDVFDADVQAIIRSYAPYDAIISDAAPNTTGNRSVDTSRSAALVEQVLYLAGSMLTPGGNLVAKVFQGGEEQQLLREVRLRFETGRLIKPEASRSESFETFLIGTGFRGAGDLDGRSAGE